MKDREWQLAVATSSALNSKWSHSERPLPFSPRDFMEKTAAETKQAEEQEAKLRKAQQIFLASGLRAMQKSIRKEQEANGTTRTS